MDNQGIGEAITNSFYGFRHAFFMLLLLILAYPIPALKILPDV